MPRIQRTYKFRLYPKNEQEEKLLTTIEICRQVYNYFLSQWNGKEKIPSRFELQAQLPKMKKENPELNKVYSKVLQMVRVDPRGTSKGLSYEDPYRDYIAARRILYRGWGVPVPPAEAEPLLVEIPASSVVEAGSPQAYSRG